MKLPTKRFNVSFTQPELLAIQKLATEKNITSAELIRRGMKHYISFSKQSNEWVLK